MKELVGHCITCSKEIFCLEGFFNGVLADDRKMYCYECYESNKKSPQE
ncbi:hypothetical protein [Neobacillus sp. DY30]|nr:hypothetical protein [Neobacillus sp. DY30]WHX99044.1 hypothetical protein QNH29_20930 [Neobacillus sp. DY30]